jgi:hypothetical protein
MAQTATSPALPANAAALGPPIRYGEPRIVCFLANQQVSESSGLACSRRSPGVFWTHNDSGDAAQVYAFDAKGRHLATCKLTGAQHRDWEDIASFRLAGKGYLLIADTGDNEQKRPFVTLYLAEEPAVDPNKTNADGAIRLARAIHFTFDDGPQDCESVAVDATTQTVYLVSKRAKRTVYELPLSARTGADGKCQAKTIARLDIGGAVAMDISPDGLRAVVLTYAHAYEYTRRAGQKWAAAFASPGRLLPMPGRRQGESIC